MIRNIQNTDGIGLSQSGRLNIIWGIDDVDPKKLFQMPISGIPDGAISVKRVARRKDAAKVEIEFSSHVAIHILEMDGQSLKVGLLEEIREK